MAATTRRNCCIFQFSPLREGRLIFKQWLSEYAYFNSRPCVRGDLQEEDAVQNFIISILAPA